MLILKDTDILRVVTDAAVTVDVHASAADVSSGGVVTLYRKLTPITLAATTDVALAPAAGSTRTVETLFVRNKHASASVGITVQVFDGTTTAELWKGTLLAGHSLFFAANVVPQVLAPFRGTQFAQKAADEANLTVSLANIADLTFPVEANGVYHLNAMLIYLSSVVTTGVGFSVNGPAGAVPSMGCTIIGARAAAPAAGSITSYPITAHEGVVNSGGVEVITTDYIATIVGRYVVGGTAGTLALRHRSETANSTTVRAGSNALLTRIS